jgi:hypothetical protein
MAILATRAWAGVDFYSAGMNEEHGGAEQGPRLKVRGSFWMGWQLSRTGIFYIRIVRPGPAL